MKWSSRPSATHNAVNPDTGYPSSSSPVAESAGAGLPATTPAWSATPDSEHGPLEPNGQPSSPTTHQQPPRKLAPSLSGRQLLNQRLQKYKLPAVFRVHLVGPPQQPRWKGSFWIKDTLLGCSRLEHSKAAAKEGAAMAALKWLNSNHYY